MKPLLKTYGCRCVICQAAFISTDPKPKMCPICDSEQPIDPFEHMNQTPIEPEQSILLEAHALINGPRREAYGPYTDEAKAVATIWSALLKFEVQPRLVPLMLIALKLHREAHQHGVDNLRDTCGYAALAHQVAEASGEKP